MTNPRQEDYGLHLTADGYGAQYEHLTDLPYIWRFLDDLPGEIGMSKITQPYVFPYCGKAPAEWGITGGVFIAESHLCLHTYPEYRALFFDCFSCGWFDAHKVTARLQEAFGVEEVTSHLLPRGAGFRRRLVQPGVYLPEQIYGGRRARDDA